MPTVLRALIIDDEAPARDLLWALLADHPNVKVVGEANCATAAASLYADLRPEVVFLDVHMPNGDGFSLLPKLQPMPAVIFVTAYDRFAVRAFEANAVDYLLKPIRSERLADALQRIFHRPRPLQVGPYSLDDQIFLRSDSKMRLVFVAQITAIEADANYTRIHLADGSSTFVRRGITEWETLLPKPFFLRADRSLIVRLQAVRKIVIETDHVSAEVEGFARPITLSHRASIRLRRALRGLKTL
ncbi:MAG: response regulator [Terrimicrobiaceae bacterium]